MSSSSESGMSVDNPYNENWSDIDWDGEDDISVEEDQDVPTAAPTTTATTEKWKKNATFQPNCPVFIGNLRLNPRFNNRMTPLKIFQYFLNEAMVDDILKETNRYVEQRKSTSTTFSSWLPLEKSDFWKFTALCFLMGLVKKPTITDYWSQDLFTLTPYFGEVMPRTKFENILRGLHFVNNRTQKFNNDRFAKLGLFFDTLNANFYSAVEPGEYLCIDESLMKYKGRLSFKQYVPLKRARFGIKFFVLMDVKTGLVMRVLPYQGKNTKLSLPRNRMGFGGAAVLTLLQGLLFKHHRVIIDNYFVSPTLADELKSKSTYMLGTVKGNRKGMPKLTGKLNKGAAETYSLDGKLLERWQDRRQVLVLNTFTPHEMKEVVSNNPNNTRLKPRSVTIYNKMMGTVDDADKIIKPYESIRKTRKWYRKVYFHCLDISMYNSFKIFKRLQPGSNLSYYEFIQSVMGEIIAAYPSDPVKKGRPILAKNLDQERLVGKHFPEKCTDANGKSKFSDCVYCRMLNKRKMTTFQCSNCKKRLCIDGIENSFKKFHTDVTLPNRKSIIGEN